MACVAGVHCGARLLQLPDHRQMILLGRLHVRDQRLELCGTRSNSLGLRILELLDQRLLVLPGRPQRDQGGLQLVLVLGMRTECCLEASEALSAHLAVLLDPILRKLLALLGERRERLCIVDEVILALPDGRVLLIKLRSVVHVHRCGLFMRFLHTQDVHVEVLHHFLHCRCHRLELQLLRRLICLLLLASLKKLLLQNSQAGLGLLQDLPLLLVCRRELQLQRGDMREQLGGSLLGPDG
mmetsp:Transcript_55145/g.118425  ORF Transcript_55145/g.118425 Transcript_55145/m.118425 type:complete len:240 (+) Transcript_55145:3505-4224(+)